MGKNSKIEWCDHTFNAWIGCQKVSPGCQFCYAERETFVRRERSHGRELWGPSGFRHRTSKDYWRQPLLWNAQNWWSCLRCGWRGEGHFTRSLPWLCPSCVALSEMEPARPRVFCMSMGDIFENRPELEPWRLDLLDLISRTQNLDWLILTKRIELATQMMPAVWPENVWIGTSVENQKMADERIPELIKCPAPIKFLSVEPMLGPINLGLLGTLPKTVSERYSLTCEHIKWVIVGGESGPKCRPFQWDWARRIRDECQKGDVSFFMKQGGGYPDKKDSLDDLPPDLRIRMWPL